MSLAVPTGHLRSIAVTACLWQSPLVNADLYRSPQASDRLNWSLQISSGHCMSLAVSTGHCQSVAVTACFWQSPLVTTVL